MSGAVKTEKVVRLAYGSRVEDAIEAAGGLKKDADMTSVNRAQILTDGEKVYIPEEGEGTEGTGSGGSGSGTGAASATAPPPRP